MSSLTRMTNVLSVAASFALLSFPKEIVGDAIRKQYTFRDFLEAIAFVNCLAPKAEAADHHPDILINYKRVTLTYSTHSESGLTVKSLSLPSGLMGSEGEATQYKPFCFPESLTMVWV